MSSRAHRPADEGLADFGAPQLVATENQPVSDTGAGREPDADVVSSEREARSNELGAATPRADAMTPRVDAMTPRVDAIESGDVPSPGAAAVDVEPVAGADQTSPFESPSALGGVDAGPEGREDAPEVREDAPKVFDDAPKVFDDAPKVEGERDPVEDNLDTLNVADPSVDVSTPDSESTEIQEGDIESVELRERLDVAGDVDSDLTEMTADELALETQSEGALDPSWTDDSMRGSHSDPAGLGPSAELCDSAEAGYPGADYPASVPSEAGAGRGSFEPPWVDEVPDPVTPYEQRVSETVRVADLPSAEQLRGRVLANRYIAEEIAEQTPSSINYRAYHLALDRAVSVRILPRGLACPDETCQEVRRLAAIATGLGHPNVAATLDFGVLPDGWPFLVTEHRDGQTLGLLLRQEGKFVLRRVLHIGKQLAAGLGAAHEAGLVHGLLNPDNVLVIAPGTSAEVATILGFGVSSARGSTPGTPRSGVFGVPFYVSPEQAGCRALDARSDIYSLGVLLYELMTGRPPFTDGDFAGVLCQHLDDEAPAPSSRLRSPGALAKAMDAIVQRCLRKEPARRYQTAAELAEDLVRLEAAAARSKRRPMPEVKRPTTTIHSPPPKAAEGTAGPEAKVIVHGDEDETDDSGESNEAAAEPPAPAPRSRPAASTPVSSSHVAPRDGGLTSVMQPVVGRAPRVSVDQATIKISAVDRAKFVAARPGAPISSEASALATKTKGGGFGAWLQSRFAWLLGALQRLFGGGPNDSPRS